MRALVRRLAPLAALVGCAMVSAPAAAAMQAGFDCSPSCEVTPGTTVTFTSGSPSQPIRNYEWDLDGDGLHGAADDPDEPYGRTAQSAARAFPDAGLYTVGLRVTTARGETSTAARTVVVAGGTAPAAGPDALVPPTPAGDEDGDKVPNGRDLCPATAKGLRPVERGCSLVEVIVSPAALLDRAATSVARARGELRTLSGLRRPLKLLQVATNRLRLAGSRLGADPCLGSRTAGGALDTAGKGAGAVSKLVDRRRRSVITAIGRLRLEHPEHAGDTDTLDARVQELSLKREQAQAALADLRRIRRLFATACRAKVGKRERTIRARVTELDPSSSLAKLSDGTAVALAGADGVTGIGPGMAVSATGTLLEGGVLVAEKITAKGLKFNPKQLPCALIPKIAPVQDFTPSFTDILYYDRRGYLEGDKYVLEGGMGINADRTGSCSDYDDYRLHLSLDYRDAAGKQIVARPIGWVRGFSDSDPPARIPLDLHPDSNANAKAKLTFRLWGYDCTDATLTYCAGAQLLSHTTAPARLRPKGGWGTAVYDRTRYSVEDGSKTDFDTASLLGVNTPPGTLPDPTVFGVGYGLSGGQSTFPNRTFILDDEPFAVHDDVPAPDVEAYQDGKDGIPGGLLWAYITGYRGGHQYHYVAKLPNIVTDVVSFCPVLPNSFYRLPWQAGFPQSVTQGNFGGLTHGDDPASPGADQAYAFDFKMPDTTIGHATRGGWVEAVQEKLTENSNPKAVKLWKAISNGKIDLYKPGNELHVRHQDGTLSTYIHMRKNGVYPEEGDVVERGDPVIVVGNTGNSTGPHLHYHVTGDQPSETIQIRFELAPALAPTIAVPCATPEKTFWVSTNKKPSS